MQNRLITRFILASALLILVVPAVASAQYYRDQYDRSDRRDLRDAIAQLDNAGAQLESDLTAGRERRVLGGLFWVRNVDTTAAVEVRDFRSAVRDLRRSVRGDLALERSVDEARDVINRGVELDRYLRLRTGRTSVDADLAEIRSNLHVIADAYNLGIPY